VTQRRIQLILRGLWFVACASLATPAPAQESAVAGQWTRSVRPDGESWIYHFTVTGGAAAETARPAGALSGGGAEAPRLVEHSDNSARSDASVRRVGAAPRADEGGGAANVDLAVARAYTRTATDGGGVEVAAPAVGETVYFYVDYSLTGATGVYLISRQAIFDGEDFCHTTQTTSAGDHFAWCPNGWTATPGDHTLRWDFDYNNMLTETDENNNSASATWTSSPTGEVDLEAQRAYLRTAAGGQGNDVTTPEVGQTIYFYVDFSIVGAGDAVVSSRRAVLDGETYCSFTSTSAPGNYFAWCNDGWTATPGDHTLQWDLDYDNMLTESDENNNSTLVTWTSEPTGGIDIEAQRAYLNTMPASAGDEVTTPTAGQAVYFHLAYRIVGSGGAVPVDRRAVLDGEPFCTFSTMSMPGGYLTWCVDAWTAVAGTHTLEWDLDFDDMVAETDETNNSVSTMWTTGGETCGGDCNGDGAVQVDDLISMVNDALNDTLLCAIGDTNDDGSIDIDDIVVSVNHALTGCI
jgi:hypothetical protein